MACSRWVATSACRTSEPFSPKVLCALYALLSNVAALYALAAEKESSAPLSRTGDVAGLGSAASLFYMKTSRPLLARSFKGQQCLHTIGSSLTISPPLSPLPRSPLPISLLVLFRRTIHPSQPDLE